MDFEESQVFQYHIVITPEIPEDSRQLRQDIIRHYTSQLEAEIGPFYNSGYTLYSL